MAGAGPIPEGFDVARFRMLTAASGACFGGFLGLVLCTMFGWFGRPQWWWLAMLGLFGAGLWYSHREAGFMRSQLVPTSAPAGESAEGQPPSSVTAEPPMLERYCGYCQNPVRRGVSFCTSCGQHWGTHGGYFE